MNKIKVAIVEDDSVWLKALTSFLNFQEDIIVAEMATNKEDAVNMARTSLVDVIIMDINLNENKRDGILAAVEILESVKVKIIMLTSELKHENYKHKYSVSSPIIFNRYFVSNSVLPQTN